MIAQGQRRTVFVERKPGTFEDREIDARDGTAGSVVVTSGLRDGERVVTESGLLLAQQIAEARGGSR